MTKKFGLFSIILLGVNAVIGNGIFLLPGKAMELVGPASMFVYLLVTIAAIAIAFCFAECASLFHRNGAAYVYSKEAFGDFIGFEVGIMKWAVSIISWAALSVGFVTVLSQIYPVANQEPYRTFILIGMIASLGTMNIFGLQAIRFLNNMITIGKMVPIILFVILGTMYMEFSNFYPFLPQKCTFESFGTATLIIFFAFAGFETLAVAAEDMDNPQKNLPVAIISVLAISSLIYFLVQAVVIGVLGQALSKSNTPIADAANVMFGSMGMWLVTISMLIASMGTNIASSFLAPRSGVALAQDQMIPPMIARKGKFGTPIIAILITTCLTIGLALTGSFVKLATISVIARLAQYFPTCLAVLVLRKKRPDLTSSFPRILGPAIPLFALLFTVWLLSTASIDEIYWGLGGLLLGLPIYFGMKLSSKQTALT